MNATRKRSIATQDLCVGYDDTIILEDISIAIPSGKISSIIGANGCGKSTLLRTIARILTPLSGTVLLNGKDIKELQSTKIAQQMANLPQNPTAPSAITCQELVAYGRFPYQKGFGRMSKEDRQVVEQALEMIGMVDFRNREIGSLSGGQRQKIWIALALAQGTDILLLDEPITFLDLAHQIEVLEILRNLNRRHGKTIVMVLHDLNLASRYSDYLFAMKNGAIAYSGKPQEVITKEMLKTCFKVKGDIVQDPGTGKPFCLSFNLLDTKENFALERREC